MLAAAFVAACGPGGGGATFDPSGPCVVDGQAEGAYPDLEAELPTRFADDPPTSRDSGRHCSEAQLGTLAGHDVEALEFAGATWDLGDGLGVGSVVFRVPGEELPAAWIGEFYEAGARAGRKTDNIETSRPTFDGAGETWRLDTLNDLSFQTVVTWQDGALVRSVLVASPVRPDRTKADHDALVEGIVEDTVAARDAAG